MNLQRCLGFLHLGILIAILLPVCSCRGKPSRLPNVLLISLDACRADHLSSYGYSRKTSPFLDEIAVRGVRFSNAFVNTHPTFPSHTTILSSLYQETHRVKFNQVKGYAHYMIPESVVLLQQHLKNHGYLTLGVTGGGFMSGRLGFARGFDEFDDQAEGVVSGTRKLVDLVRKHHRDKHPIFAFYHTYEIHSPYHSPEKYRQIFGTFESDFNPSSKNLALINKGRLHISKEDVKLVEAMYDAGIKYTDDTLREFFQTLEDMEFFENYLVIITSDHGEELGERGGFLHRDLLYDSLIHVPLIIAGTSVPKGKVDNRMVSSIDIAPTIMDYVGINVESPMEGRSLLKTASKAYDKDAVFSQREGRRYAIRTADWKLIMNVGAQYMELYDLKSDLQEKRNVAETYPKRVRLLQDRLLAWKKRLKRHSFDRIQNTKLSDKDLQRLKSLGYVD